HRRVMLFIHESVKPHCSIQERIGGYRTARDEAGLVTSESVRVSEGEATEALVRGEDRPTAVVCYSDLESTLLAHALWQYGLAVPGDISLIGFNDVFATRYMTPPLTTVSFDAAKIGELGAQILLKAIGDAANDRQPEVLTVKPKLVCRCATAAPGLREGAPIS